MTFRYGLNDRKHKQDRQYLRSAYPDRKESGPTAELRGLVCQKSFPPPSPLVLSLISNSSENEMLGNATTDWMSLPGRFVDKKLTFAKSRTLIFVRPSEDYSRMLIYIIFVFKLFCSLNDRSALFLPTL